MPAEAAQTTLNRFGVTVGNSVAVATLNDSAWYAAFDLMDAGAFVVAIVDTLTEISPALLQGAASRKIEILSGRTVTGAKGRLHIASVRVTLP